MAGAIVVDTSSSPPSSANVLQLTLATFPHLDLTERVQNISPVKAFGGYCDVFVGYCTSATSDGPMKKVAIKRLRVHILEDRDFGKMLAKEIRVWAKLDHPNILSLLGYVLEDNDCPSLVSEWMENGTAMKYLKSHPECDVLSIALGIAEGISYLHDRGIIHSDVKAENVLVSPLGVPLICDFGISRILAASQTFGASSNHAGGLRGTARWMAIELIQPSDPPNLHSKQSDVWAFGMTLYELLTKGLPYAHIAQDIHVMFVIASGSLPPSPLDLNIWQEVHQALWHVCLECWEADPRKRPSMATIISKICQLTTGSLPSLEQIPPGVCEASVEFSPSKPLIPLSHCPPGPPRGPSRLGKMPSDGLKDTVNNNVSSNDHRKHRRGKRVMVISEIVETERMYVEGLKELINIYVRPSATPASIFGGVVLSGRDTIIPEAERKIVFDGLEALASFHQETLLPAFESAAAPLLSDEGQTADADSEGILSYEIAMKFGQIFVSLSAFFKMYISYMSNFEIAVQRIRHWLVDEDFITHGETNALSSGQRVRIKRFLKACYKKSRIDLEGYILAPVQRIPRYRLLVQELRRSTPPPPPSVDSPEDHIINDSAQGLGQSPPSSPPIGAFEDHIDRALVEISSIVNNMEMSLREAESRRKLVQWQTRIRGKFPSPLIQPHRRLIKDGLLILIQVIRKQQNTTDVQGALASHYNTLSSSEDGFVSEIVPCALQGILCNDLLALCQDSSKGQDPQSFVDLWAVLRIQTMPQRSDIVHGNVLKLVDAKATLYLEAQSPADALAWLKAINMHIPTTGGSAI